MGLPDRDERQEKTTIRTLHALLLEALDYERRAFETDDEVQGGDLCQWFGAWRARVQAELIALMVADDRATPKTHAEAIRFAAETLLDLEDIGTFNDDHDNGDAVRACIRLLKRT